MNNTPVYVITDDNHDYGRHDIGELTVEVRKAYKLEIPDATFYAFSVDSEGNPETQYDAIFTW